MDQQVGRAGWRATVEAAVAGRGLEDSPRVEKSKSFAG